MHVNCLAYNVQYKDTIKIFCQLPKEDKEGIKVLWVHALTYSNSRKRELKKKKNSSLTIELSLCGLWIE